MPSKAPKRAAPSSPAPAEKRVKQDPLMAGVLDAIQQAQGLPESCRAMLTAAIPSCLGTPSEERHEHQAKLVTWIGEVMDGVQAKLQESFGEAKAAEASMAATKEGLDGKVQSAKVDLQQKEEAVAAKSSALKDAEAAVAGMKQALAEAEDAQRLGDSRFTEAGKEKKQLEEALEQHVLPLKEVEGFQADQAKVHLEVVLPIAKRLTLDDSLVIALPNVVAREPGARGAFDCMVLDQLETSLRTHVARLASELEAGAPAAAERAAAVHAAKEKARAAEDDEKAAEGGLAAARAAEAEAAAALARAEVAVEAFVSGRSAEVKAFEAKEFALQNFTGYNVECFVSLRNSTASAGA